MSCGLSFLSEGGRLEKELRYVRDHLGEGAGATSQMVIQTPRRGGASVLSPEAMLEHLDVIRAAAKVVVETDDA